MGCFNVIIRIEEVIALAVRRAGPTLLVVTCALLGLVTLAFGDLLLQVVMPLPHKMLHLLPTTAILGNIAFHLKKSAFASPGFTSEVDPGELSQVAQHGGWRWCKRCQLPKPPLCHHCRLCGKCVLRMDHHCPWLNNCIGHGNYRSFLLLIAYVIMGCAYAAPWFWQATARGGRHALALPEQQSPLLASPAVALLCLSLSAAGGGACTLLLGWHLYLVLTGQTTIECYDSAERKREGRGRPNVYNLGWRENFKECFGARGQWWWLAWLLPWPSQPRGSGVRFRTIHDMEADAAGGGGAEGSNPFSPKFASSATTQPIAGFGNSQAV